MEARLFRAALLVAVVGSLGASHRTQNFIITASSPQFAQEVGEWSEKYRRDLAIDWLGQELPPWSEPCPITVHSGPHLGAGGATSFAFQGRMPVAWKMTIQGSRERILDSVLPHEITHTIFATHFGRPLPRWADEGACTTVEHPSEVAKQQQMLIEFLTTNRGIPFNRMFVMMQYPPDMLSIYAQGHSVASFLILQGGRQKFIKYIEAGLESGNWNRATDQFYGYRDLSDLQVTWLDWVRKGRPDVQPRVVVASNDNAAPAAAGATRATFASAPQPNRIPPSDRAAPNAPQLADNGAALWRHRDDAGPPPLTPDQALMAEARDRRGADPVVAAMPRYAPGSTGTVRMIDTSTARPPSVEQARQTILEWERPGPGAAAE